jgi:hypothetical protein
MAIRPLILFSSLLLLSACNKVTEENYTKLSAGMAKTEVQALLGAPSECSGALGMSSCTWGDDKASVSVQFAADKVVLFSGHGLK